MKENTRATGRQENGSAKGFYSTPKLIIYGEIRSLTQGGGTQSNEGNEKRPIGSDRRIKEKIVRIDTHPLGIGVYLFDFKAGFRDSWGHGRQFGVMAGEVEQVIPEAVFVHPDGYKMVNYAMLGISRNLH